MTVRMQFRLFLLFIMLLPAVAQTESSEKIPVILSTDVGNEIDDQWTVVYSLIEPRLDVLGITSVHAPTISPPAGDTSYQILLDVVENRLGMVSHPPLYPGADLPLEDRETPRENEAVEFIIETSKQFSAEDRLTLLTVGAVTDAASAILKDPTIVERIQIVDMGFRSWPEGGKEFNIANDVKAMQVILESEVPLIVGSAEVCRESLSLTLRQAREMVKEQGPVGNWLWREFQAYYYRFVKPRRVDDFSKPWVIWDNITLAYVLGMTEAEVYSRPALGDDMTFEHSETNEDITWITDVDEDRLWGRFLERLERYQRTHAVGRQKARTFLLMPY